MKKFFFLLIMCLSMLMTSMVQSDAASVRTIVGMQSDVTGVEFIPLSASLMCDGTGVILDCPQFFAPDWGEVGTAVRFFGITNRTNPPRCVQSTDGGATWGLCPSNPFSAAIDVFGASFSVATDGSLIAFADQGANNCIFRRSTDYGVSWSTVFTDTTAGVSCGIGFGNPTMNMARCSDTSGYCILVGRGAGPFEEINYFSTDNGANWTKSTSFTMVSGDPQKHLRFGPDDESAGVTSNASVTYASTLAGVKSGNVFINTVAIPTPPGSGPGARCPGALVMGSTRVIICGPDSLNPNTYRRFNVIGTTPTHINAFTFNDNFTNANSPDFSGIGFNSTTAYMQGRSLASGRIELYVTQDGFVTAPRLASILPATALIAGCCRGDWWVRAGKIYFTIGGTSSNAVFGRIQ